MVKRLKRNFQGGGMDSRHIPASTPTRTSRGHGVTSSRPDKPSPTRTSRGHGVTSSRPDKPTKTVSHTPQRDTDHVNEFAGWEGSEAARLAKEAAALQAQNDKDEKIALAKRLQEQRDERDRKGTTYDPKGGRGTGDKMAADFFGINDPNALHAWTTYDAEGKPIGHTGTLDEMAAALDMGKVGAFGEPSDVDRYKYGMFDYGEFGYGPGPQWDKELTKFFGGKPQEGFSHAQLTEYLYSIGAHGIDDRMFLGGKPGQIGYGPGEKPDWYGKPRTGSTGGDGQNDQGGYSYGYEGQGGEGSGYGYGGGQDPLERGYQKAKFGPGDLMERVNQNLLRLAGLRKKRGGIVSLLELSR